MGYPMTYSRLISRNRLGGDYVCCDEKGNANVKGLIAGDMRRLENDQRDLFHLEYYSKLTGISKPKIKKVLDAFFEGLR